VHSDSKNRLCRRIAKGPGNDFPAPLLLMNISGVNVLKETDTTMVVVALAAYGYGMH